jgi:NAD(P)-dependent dehydrogenase (short-subunit alcohol dehydrogenase family)
MAGRLEGRVAIVTGAGRGIGRATAVALAREGCRLALASRTNEEINAAAREIEGLSRRAIAVQCDVSAEPDVRSLVEKTLGEFGAVHIVVNNAGTQFREPLVDYTVADWDDILNSHVRGMFLVTRLALPSMLEQGWGRVVTVASMAAKTGVPRRVAYCTAKWGQIGFTEALDEELKGSAVRAHVVCPGPVATRMRVEGFPNEVPESLIQPEDVAAQIVNLLTLPETAYVREVCIQNGQPIRYR